MRQPRIGSWWQARRSVVWECLVVVAVAATSGCRNEQPDAASAPAPPATPSSPAVADDVDPAHPVASIETSLGTIVVRLDAEHAPATVNNFVIYAEGGFYNGTLFHFVDPGNMILGGGYTADHRLKPAGMAIRSEADNGLKNTRGTIAMARDQSAIDSATSQFFINLADAPQRDHRGPQPEQYGYCVFGEVVEGLDVADQISRAPTQDLGGDLAQTPQPPVTVEAIRIAR